MLGCAVVSEVSAELVAQLVNGIRTHVDDLDVAAPLCFALAKLCDHPQNSLTVARSPLFQPLSVLLKQSLDDVYTAEAVVSLLRPLSVIPEVRAR